MDRQTAERLMEEMRKLSDVFNNLTEITLTMSDDQARSMRRTVVDTIFKGYSEIIDPIVRAYPELDPDRGPTTASSSRTVSGEVRHTSRTGGHHG